MHIVEHVTWLRRANLAFNSNSHKVTLNLKYIWRPCFRSARFNSGRMQISKKHWPVLDGRPARMALPGCCGWFRCSALNTGILLASVSLAQRKDSKCPEFSQPDCDVMRREMLTELKWSDILSNCLLQLLLMLINFWIAALRGFLAQKSWTWFRELRDENDTRSPLERLKACNEMQRCLVYFIHMWDAPGMILHSLNASIPYLVLVSLNILAKSLNHEKLQYHTISHPHCIELWLTLTNMQYLSGCRLQS